MIGADEFHIAAADTSIGLAWMMQRALLRDLQSAALAPGEQSGSGVAMGASKAPLLPGQIEMLSQSPPCAHYAKTAGGV